MGKAICDPRNEQSIAFVGRNREVIASFKGEMGRNPLVMMSVRELEELRGGARIFPEKACGTREAFATDWQMNNPMTIRSKYGKSNGKCTNKRCEDEMYKKYKKFQFNDVDINNGIWEMKEYLECERGHRKKPILDRACEKYKSPYGQSERDYKQEYEKECQEFAKRAMGGDSKKMTNALLGSSLKYLSAAEYAMAAN